MVCRGNPAFTDSPELLDAGCPALFLRGRLFVQVYPRLSGVDERSARALSIVGDGVEVRALIGVGNAVDEGVAERVVWVEAAFRGEE